MTTFDDRESAFENKQAHDEQTQFRIMARRNKLLGLWAAEKLGLSGDAAAAYATEVVKSDMAEAGDDDVLRKVSSDFAAKGIESSDADLRAQMTALLDVAHAQITDGA